MSFPFLIQGNNITVVIGNKPHTISKTHITFEKVKEAIKADDWDKVKDLIEPKKVVLNYGKGNVSVQGEQLFWKGQLFANALATRMIQMLQDGFPIDPMVAFMENLMSNPSKRAVTELYGFLEKNNLPITPDGHFLAYKKVRENYFDVHSGTMDNSVGKVVEMERNAVDDDKDRTCSTGLHFCAHSYLAHFGGERVVIVKVNPRDVVSIPSDYNDAKGRACRYEVIGEVGVNPDDGAEFDKPVQANANSVPVQKVTVTEPVVPQGTKKGSSAFYRGYTAGYTDSDWDTSNLTRKGVDDYMQGFDKGQLDREDGVDARYEYVGTSATTATPATATVVKGGWPFPTGNK